MQLKLTLIAAALALGTASFAQAEDKADRKVHNADEERIESEYKAAKEKCDSMQGNQKDICVAEAKATEKVAKPRTTRSTPRIRPRNTPRCSASRPTPNTTSRSSVARR